MHQSKTIDFEPKINFKNLIDKNNSFNKNIEINHKLNNLELKLENKEKNSEKKTIDNKKDLHKNINSKERRIIKVSKASNLDYKIKKDKTKKIIKNRINNKKSLSSNRSIDSYDNIFLGKKMILNNGKKKDNYYESILQKKKDMKMLGFFHTDKNFYPKDRIKTGKNKAVLFL